MKIKWNDTFEIEIVDQYDEELDNITSSHNEILKKGEVEEIDITKDNGDYVDMQFENGSMAFSIQKSTFIIVWKRKLYLPEK